MESATASAAHLGRGSLLRIQSDERLAQLASAGRDDAYEILVRRHRRSLLRAARRILPDDRAEDAVQQALLDAHRAIGRGHAPERFRPWLHRIAVNAALKELRADRDTVPLSEELNGVEGPADAHERRESVHRMVRAIRGLPERQRRALVARELEGRSHEEIARELGLSGGAVRQLIHRARGSVRAAASMLIPPELLLRLLGTGGATPATEAAAAGGGAAVAAKMAAVAVVIGGVAGGVALERTERGQSGSSDPPDVRGAVPGGGESSDRGPLLAQSGIETRGSEESRHGGGGSSHGGDGSSSGPGAGAGDRHSDSGSSDSGPSGSGDDDFEPEEEDLEEVELEEVELDDDSSGSESSGSGSSGSSGSGSSGSGSLSSGSSGSGSSGSGSSGSGSSGSDDPDDD